MTLDVAQLCARLIRFDTTNRGGGDSAGEREAAEHVATILQDNGVPPTLLAITGLPSPIASAIVRPMPSERCSDT